MFGDFKILLWVYKFSCVLLMSLYPFLAFAVSTSVSATVGSTTVSINASAGGFVNDTHCSDPNFAPTDPACPSVYRHQGGSVSVYLDNSYFGGNSTSIGSSISFGATLSRATLSQGDHTVRATGSDGHGSVTNTTTFTIDNTPSVSISAPSGTFPSSPKSLAGTASFVGGADANGRFGTVYVYVYAPGGTLKWNTSGTATSSSFDLSTLPVIPIDGSWGNGAYRVEARAYAINATSSPSPFPTTTFTIDNTPSVSLTSPSGMACGDAVPLSGSVDFVGDPAASGSYGTVYVYVRATNGALVFNASANATTSSFDLSSLGPISLSGQADATYTVQVVANAANGATASVTNTFDKNSNMSCVPSQASPLEAALAGTDSTKGAGVCIADKTANPIYFMTGDKEQVDTDFSFGGLSFKRTYHSQSTHGGRMGYGWTSSYDWGLAPPVLGKIGIRRDDGKLMTFIDDGTGVFVRQLERADETVVVTATGYRYTNHDRSTVDFDVTGKLVSLNNEGGQSTHLTYDANGKLTGIVDPFGRSVTVVEDASGHVSSITDSMARVWSYAYDINNNLKSVTHPDGTSRQYVYADANDIHNLTQVIDEAGQIFKQITYDAQDRSVTSELPLINYQDNVIYNADGTVSVIESNGRTVDYVVSHINTLPYIASRSDCACGAASDFTYDPYSGVLLSNTDKNGVGAAYNYDGKDRLLTRTEAVGTAVERTTSYVYDAVGHMVSTTDALGFVTAYSYDIYGRVLTTTDALGSVATNAWNADATLASRTAVGGGVTSYTYDIYGQVINVVHPDGSTQSMSYDAVGRLLSTTDTSGATTTYTYDTRDRVVSTTYADGTSSSNVYDVLGDLVSSTDIAGLTTTYTYDVDHRPLTVTRPDGSLVTSTYDTKGNLTLREIKDVTGAVISSESMVYDANGRLMSTTHIDSTSTSNTYDILGRLLTSTNEAGTVTTHVYDELGRVVSTTNGNGETVNYAYDVLGRRISVTDAGGVSTSFTYDGLGRVLTETSADRGVTLYSYDAANLLSKTDANGVVINDVYDSMNRLTNINYPSDATRNVSFTYDAAGRKVSMLDIVGVTSYAYNVMGRVIAIDWQPTGMTFIAHVGYSYNNGRLSSITYPSGKVVSYTYDVVSGKLSGMNVNGQPLVSNMVFSPLGVLSSQTLGNGLVETRESDSRGRLTSISSPGFARSLVWSPDSMISNINDSLDPYANQSFAYDLSGRLTQATGTYGNITYSYDANGNRMSKSDAAGSSNYVYAAGSNRLQSVAGSNYALDAAGNTTRSDIKRMTYSANNRMTRYKDASTGAVSDYYHNGLGECAAKRVTGKLTLYLYDLSGNLIAEYDKSTRATTEYIYGASGRLATLSNQIYWHHNDHLGTPQAMTDINGTTIWAMSQTPFGIATVNEDPDQDGITVTNNFRFPGQYYDAETGLNYNYYRTYDPAGGRYTQHDPIGLNGGMNPFGYVGGNPITRIDPLGLLLQAVGTVEQKSLINHWLSVLSSIPDREVRSRFQTIKNSPKLFSVGFESGRLQAGGYNNYRVALAIQLMGPNQRTFSYRPPLFSSRKDEGVPYFTIVGVIAHELLGHGIDDLNCKNRNEQGAIDIANKVRDHLGIVRRGGLFDR